MKPNPSQSSPLDTTFNSFLRFQLGILFSLYLLRGLSSAGFGVILPDFSATYNLDKNAVGYLFLAATLGYFIAALLGGWFFERLGMRNYLFAGLLLFGAGCLGLWLQPLFLLALFSRLLLGLAGAIMEVGGNSFLATQPRNSEILNYLHAFFGVGALAGPIIATRVVGNGWGWNTLFLIWLIPTLILGVGFLLAFRSPIVKDAEKKAIEATSKPMLTVLKIPVVWLTILFLTLYVGLETTVGSWSYSYLVEWSRYNPTMAGTLVSIYWLGLTLGRFVLGWLMEWLGLAGREGTFLLICMGGSLLGAILLWIVPQFPIISGFGLFLIGFSYGPLYPTVIALISRAVATKLISSSIALISGLTIIGGLIFPWIGGSLSETWGLSSLFPYITGLEVLMLIVAAVLLVPGNKAINK